MDLNTLGILALGALAYYGFTTIQAIPKEQPLTPWNEQVGKTRSLQAKGDASMYIENVRRKAIKTLGRFNSSKIKETQTLIGSTTGYLETFMITGIYSTEPVEECKTDILFDGGNASDEYCPVDGSKTYDAGNQNTEVCGH